VTFFLAILALAAPGSVQSAVEPELYAKVASGVTQAIYAGMSLREIELVPPLTEAERVEISKLAGCKPSLRSGTTKNFVSFNWSCDAVSPSGKGARIAPRTVTMRFTDEGKMFSFTVNPAIESFAPTPAALAARDLPKKKPLAQAFGQAVRDGADPTLDGLIPLTELQREQLKPFVSKNVKIYDRRAGGKTITVVWQIRSSPGDGDFSGEIYFDKDGRPIGVILEPSLIRIMKFISAKPL
jgi:hypothetical protein